MIIQKSRDSRGLYFIRETPDNFIWGITGLVVTIEWMESNACLRQASHAP